MDKDDVIIITKMRDKEVNIRAVINGWCDDFSELYATTAEGDHVSLKQGRDSFVAAT